MKPLRYGFLPAFEAVVALYTISDAGFYARLGHALEPELLMDGSAKLLVQAAHAVRADVGKAPGSAALVVQRVRRWVEEGKYKISDLNVIDTYLDQAESLVFDAEISVERAIQEALPMVQRRIKQKATEKALTEFSKDGDFEDVIALLGQAKGLGQNAVTSSGGVDLMSSLALIDEMKSIEYLATGIPELDAELMGGMPRGTETVILGRTGSGKSIFLTHTTAHSMRHGLNVAVATLELPVAVWMSRLVANLTGEPETQIRAGHLKNASQRLEVMLPSLGAIRCEHFTAHATTVQDVLTWVAHIEKSQALKIDVLVVDYADKLKTSVPGNVNDYVAMRQVYEDLRIWAEREKRWLLTASAAKAKSRDGGKGKKIDAEDAADSMHKSRVADLVVSINSDEQREGPREATFFIAKNRLGPAHISVGPLTCDFAFGRMVMI